ncbi:MAG: hypothetical protein FVQ85_13715 [Planctomycetes bacterium]|nr:hypothetical protein [Planctomycetota bacterium]
MNFTREQGSRKTTGKINPDPVLRLTEIYHCGFTGNGYNAAMKKALAHLPELKWDELEQKAPCVQKLHEVTEKICKEKIESFV